VSIIDLDDSKSFGNPFVQKSNNKSESKLSVKEFVKKIPINISNES